MQTLRDNTDKQATLDYYELITNSIREGAKAQ